MMGVCVIADLGLLCRGLSLMCPLGLEPGPQIKNHCHSRLLCQQE